MKDVKKFDVEIDERYLCDCGNGSRIIEVVSETGDYVHAADYDALKARAKTAEADFLAAAECNVEQRKTIQHFQTELATDRLRADAAVGDANAAGRCVAELEGLLREALNEVSPSDLGTSLYERIDAALAGQQQQDEPCQGANCGTTTRQHSVECRYEHFLSYSGLRDEPMLRYAYFHGADADCDQPARQVGADEREAFEAEWAAISADLPSHQRRGYSAGDVKETEKFVAWFAWEARAALAPAAVVMPARMTTIPEGKTISYAAGYEDALDAVARLNRHSPAPAIPEGYVLVPNDPTPKMIDATWHHPIDQSGGIESQNTRNERIYRAMLAAAPQPTEG